MKQYLTCFFLVFISTVHSYSQKVIYSPVDKTNFTGFESDIIGKFDQNILIYTSFYYTLPNSFAKGTVTDTNNGLDDELNNRIVTNEIRIFSNDMKLIRKKRLSLAENISAVHFIAFDDYFNMFYQYQKGHTIYCMVAKFDKEANSLGKPIQLDAIEVIDYNYQSQIYSVSISENKNFFVIYKMNNDKNELVTLNHLHFDEKFNLLQRSETKIRARNGKEFLHDFTVDNEGNFIFLRTSESYDDEYAANVALIIQSPHSDTLRFKGLISANVFIDQFHLKVDNKNKQYIISSFYAEKANGNIGGFYSAIFNFGEEQNSVITKTSFDEQMQKEVTTKGKSKEAFNDFYIQDIHLKSDGGFMIEAGNFYHFPDNHLQNRWNYLQYSSIQSAQDYLLDNQYNGDYYYPWREWSFLAANSFSYNSDKLFLMDFDNKGNARWAKVLNSSQTGRFRYSVGSSTAKMNDAIYFFYNATVKNKTFITAQNINENGEINTLENLKEDKGIMGADNDHIIFPRYGKQVSKKELVFPCMTGRYICFAKIEL